MNILGIQCGYNGSVCIVSNGTIVSYAKTGNDMERGITKKTIKEALDSAGLKLKDIDLAAVVNWFSDRDPDGTECWDKNEEKFSITKENGIEYSFDDFITFYQNNSMVAQGTYTLNIDNQIVKCMVVDHLFSHCAYTYLTSPFTECVAVCIDTHDGFGANNCIYWMQDEDKAFRTWRRDQTFAAINVYTGFTDVLGMYPAIENMNALKELALEHTGDLLDVSDWIWPQNVQMGNIFHGDQGTALMLLNGIKNIPEKFGYFPPLSGEGEIDDAWMNKKDKEIRPKRASIAANVVSVVEGSLRNYIEKTKVFGGNLAIGGKVSMFENIVDEFKDERTHFTPPCNDDELSAGAALFVSDQLMKTKKGEIITNTKKKVQSKEI
jgi:predicted NodU family carbamoyl transferase